MRSMLSVITHRRHRGPSLHHRRHPSTHPRRLLNRTARIGESHRLCLKMACAMPRQRTHHSRISYDFLEWNRRRFHKLTNRPYRNAGAPRLSLEGGNLRFVA